MNLLRGGWVENNKRVTLKVGWRYRILLEGLTGMLVRMSIVFLIWMWEMQQRIKIKKGSVLDNNWLRVYRAIRQDYIR
jgi:hypothetical protein